MAQANNSTPAQTSGNKHRAALAAAKRDKNRKILITVAVILVIALIVTPLGMFANGSIYRLSKVATVGSRSFSVSEYNYFFTTAYLNTYQTFRTNYGDYASYILNPNTKLNEQQYSEDATWADYFQTQALDNMRITAALDQEAAAAGFALTAEQQEELNSIIGSLDTTAAGYGYTAQSYLSAAYGGGVTPAVFSRCMTDAYTAQAYADSIRAGMVYTQDDLEARYNENPNNYDTVSFHLYLIQAEADSEGAVSDASKAAAKAKADDMAAAVHDAHSFGEYVRSLVAPEDVSSWEDDDATLQRYAGYSQVSAYEFGEWLFDSARKAGDTYVAEVSSGCQVIMFSSREDTRYNLVSVRHILITPELGEDETEPSDAAWDAAKAEADSLLAEWKAGDATEESFAALADEHSADSGSSGGLYENVHKGQMVAAFENWCFAPHQPGDTEVVRTNYGYHVMYFVGEGEEYWTQTLTNELQTEAFDAWQAEKLEAYPIRVNNAALRLGRHS